MTTAATAQADRKIRAPVVAGSDPSPVLEPGKRDLDLVALAI